MKRILMIGITMAFIIAGGIGWARMNVPVMMSGSGTSAEGTDVTDNFDSYDNASSLAAAANWTQVSGIWTISKPAADGIAYPDSDGALSCIRYSGASFSANQYVEATFEVGGSTTAGYSGIAVRAQSGAATWYHLAWSKVNQILALSWVVAGTGAGDIQTWESKVYETGDKIRLTVTGTGAATRLNVYEDPDGGGWDALVENKDPGADHYIDGGYPGVAGYDNLTSGDAVIEDWAGGDL